MITTAEVTVSYSLSIRLLPSILRWLLPILLLLSSFVLPITSETNSCWENRESRLMEEESNELICLIRCEVAPLAEHELAEFYYVMCPIEERAYGRARILKIVSSTSFKKNLESSSDKRSEWFNEEIGATHSHWWWNHRVRLNLIDFLVVR